jgi:membrane-bound ClpP family serine protease
MPDLSTNDAAIPPKGESMPEVSATTAETAAETKSPASSIPLPWSQFIRSASSAEIEERFVSEAKAIISSVPAVGDHYDIVALFGPEESIGQFELDNMARALLKPSIGEKDVLLLLLSPGGSIEPAYQISKLCKQAGKRFVVCIPRQAKSAATLIALGADEIHMGYLGQLGPIDPQVQGLPALGVSQALETLATLVERHPASAEMFAAYLKDAVKVEQIGYYDRICESAMQYAERLLSNKSQLPKSAKEIAHELVHEYKDHGFVIDIEEAIIHLGGDFVKVATNETHVAERFYSLFDLVNLFLRVYQSKKLFLAGSLDEGIFIWNRN